MEWNPSENSASNQTPSGENTEALLGLNSDNSYLHRNDRSIIYEKSDPAESRIVKVLLFSNDASGAYVKLVQEKLSGLESNFIAKIYSSGKKNGFYYLESEKVDGPSLEMLLQERGSLPETVAIALAIMLLKSIEFLTINLPPETDNFLRLISPSNVLLAKDGTVKISDFGICSWYLIDSLTTDTVPKSFLIYGAPEHLSKQTNRYSANVFSWGCIVYEMLMGFAPFTAKKMSLKNKQKSQYRNVSVFNKKIPSDLKKIIAKSLNRNPNARPSDYSFLLRQLEHCFTKRSQYSPEETIEYFLTTPDNDVHTRKNKSILLLISMVIMAFVALYGVFEFDSDDFSIETTFFQTDENSNKNVVNEDQLINYLFEKNDSTAPISQNKLEQDTPVTITNDPVDSSTSKELPGKKKRSDIIKKPTVNNYSRAKDSLDKKADKKKSIAPDIGPWEPIIPEFMQHEYSNKTFYEAFISEAKKKNFERALQLYSLLSDKQKKEKIIQLYRMRALIGSQNNSEIAEFFNSSTVVDKEYYFYRARYEFELRNFGVALELLNLAKGAAATLGNTLYFEQQILLHRARILTLIFNESPTIANSKTALDAWFDLKYLMRQEQKSRIYREAEKSIRLIVSKNNALL